MGPILLIGLDGATFTILDPYVDSGVMPFVGELKQRGASAVLRSIMPPLTPPAWTSLVTGKRPGQHGVFDFFQKEEPGSIYFSFTNSQDVRSETIWSLASDQGRRIISLNFPLMFPPPPVQGAVVPGGMMPWRQLRLGCHPPGLFDRLKQIPTFNPREMLDMELEVKAIDGCPEDELADFVELHIRREQRWGEVLLHLMQEEQAELIGILFDGVDKLQHLCWRFIDPACRPAHPTSWEQQLIERCERYFRSLDDLIARLVDAAGPDASVVLASDHGFGPTQDVFHVNTWLERVGYLAWANNGGSPVERADTDVGFAEMTRHVHALDWSRTLAYAATPSSQGINVVERTPGTEVLIPERARAGLTSQLEQALRDICRPDGQPLIDELWSREAAFAGPYAELGPDLSMVLAEGGTISILPSDKIVARREQPRGHHRWEGIFIACGPGVIRGKRAEELSIVDVAPFVLYQLGLGIPDDMAGRVPVPILEPEAVAARGPVLVPAALTQDPPLVAAPEFELEPGEQAAVMQRLRALGYVE